MNDLMDTAFTDLSERGLSDLGKKYGETCERTKEGSVSRKTKEHATREAFRHPGEK